MSNLYVNDNPITCLPRLKKITYLGFSNTLVNCLPSYGTVSISTPVLNTLPLCDMFNANGCDVFWNISGTAYYDANNNCSLNTGDVAQQNVKLELWSAGLLQQQVFTGGQGLYSFDVSSYGNYEVKVDTNSFPFNVSC